MPKVASSGTEKSVSAHLRAEHTLAGGRVLRARLGSVFDWSIHSFIHSSNMRYQINLKWRLKSSAVNRRRTLVSHMIASKSVSLGLPP